MLSIVFMEVENAPAKFHRDTRGGRHLPRNMAAGWNGAATGIWSARIPNFQGQCLLDDVARQSIATDWGHHFRDVPFAVVRPRTSGDVAQVVAHANKEGIKIAMRGGGHSLSGRFQVQNGIVIDSRTLNAVHLRDDLILDAQPGATWGEVAKVALIRGLTPPVMVDAMMLTVGGTLSVGGSGAIGYRFGAQVDHVSNSML
jgi:cytokinin dehydrogenase